MPPFTSWEVSLAAAKDAYARLVAGTIIEYELGGPGGKKVTKRNISELQNAIKYLESRVTRENGGTRSRRVAIRRGTW